MITVLTGTPGAGKTLYAISELLLPLWDAKQGKWKPIEKREEDGSTTLVERTVYTNINGLLLEHELVQADGEHGLHNWHKWAKPGSLIVVDEFQKIWPPRPNGAKVPDDVQAFDTHRHMGVDFILVTQNAMNVDRHLHGLTNRHLHVRRMANMHLAIVYEWDHCSRQLLYSKSLTKHPWRYKKGAFKVYKSSELHTKQKRRLPGALWFILIAVGALAYLGPTLVSRLGERTGLNAAESKGKPPTTLAEINAGKAPSRPMAPASRPEVPRPTPAASAPVLAASAPVFAGCARLRDRCQCYDTHGKRQDVELDRCMDESLANAPAKLGEPPASLARYQVQVATYSAEHAALVAWAEGQAVQRRMQSGYLRRLP